jgi:hypothetical protein
MGLADKSIGAYEFLSNDEDDDEDTTPHKLEISGALRVFKSKLVRCPVYSDHPMLGVLFDDFLVLCDDMRMERKAESLGV